MRWNVVWKLINKQRRTGRVSRPGTRGRQKTGARICPARVPSVLSLPDGSAGLRPGRGSAAKTERHVRDALSLWVLASLVFDWQGCLI